MRPQVNSTWSSVATVSAGFLSWISCSWKLGGAALFVDESRNALSQPAVDGNAYVMDRRRWIPGFMAISMYTMYMYAGSSWNKEAQHVPGNIVSAAQTCLFSEPCGWNTWVTNHCNASRLGRARKEGAKCHGPIGCFVAVMCRRSDASMGSLATCAGHVHSNTGLVSSLCCNEANREEAACGFGSPVRNRGGRWWLKEEEEEEARAVEAIWGRQRSVVCLLYVHSRYWLEYLTFLLCHVIEVPMYLSIVNTQQYNPRCSSTLSTLFLALHCLLLVGYPVLPCFQ